jgi:hypothetical protein
MTILGLAGYARSGKDTAAGVLENFGFRRIAFADKLREFMYVMNPRIHSGHGTYCNLQDIIDSHGWDGYKETVWSSDIRRWMQVVGTDCVRDILGKDTWVNATLNSLDPEQNYVITDVRFPNEVERIRQMRGGYVIRVWRPEIKPALNHISETALDDMVLDGIWENVGTREDFERVVRSRFTRYLG